MPSGGCGQIGDADAAAHVDQPALAFDEEVVVVADIGVEIGAGAVDRDFAQKPRLGELVQRVVDGGERDAHAGRLRLGVQVLGRNVAVALGEEDAAELDALARRPQPGMAKLRRHAVHDGRARGVAASSITA